MTTEELASNIYDILKVNALSDTQNDEWATLSREHAEQAKKELHVFLKDKELSVYGSTIKVGSRKVITIS